MLEKDTIVWQALIHKQKLEQETTEGTQHLQEPFCLVLIDGTSLVLFAVLCSLRRAGPQLVVLQNILTEQGCQGDWRQQRIADAVARVGVLS